MSIKSKEWRQADKALADYDAKISDLEGKLNRAKKKLEAFSSNSAKAGQYQSHEQRPWSGCRKSANKFRCVSVKWCEVL